MTLKNILKILFVEDVPSDVDLAVLELRKEKLKFDYSTVCTRNDLLKALKEFGPDVIISDYMMPSFTGLQALKVTKEFNSEIPFILYTGSVNEETAVECLKAGAEDYVIKEHMTRLPFAVKEALEQVRINLEKRASELLLKENEEKLQSIFSAAPVGIGLVVNRKLIEVNDSFCKMIGYSRSELIGKSAEILYPTSEEFINVGKDKYQQISEKGIGSVETKFKCKDGKILNVILSSTPLDKNDHSKGITFTVLDITDRKLSETALHESEERFRTLYNNAVLGLYRTNSKGEILQANLALVKMLGFKSFEELAKRNLNETGFESSYQRQQFIDMIEKEGEIKDFESVWICYDGKKLFVRENAKVIYDSDGKILYYDGSVEDITQRKKTEEALKESQNLFETLAQSSPVGIFRTNSEGYTTYVNPKWQELSGLTFDQAIGFGWLNAVHPDEREKIRQTWDLMVQLHLPSASEYRFQRRDRSIIWVMGNAVPEWIDNLNVGFIGTITDITERKESENSLRNSEERLKILFDHAPDAYYLYDLMGNFIDGNFACEKLTGYQNNELIGQNFLNIDLISRDYMPLVAELLGRNYLGHGTGPDVLEINRKDGSKVTIEIITHPVKIKDQTLVLGIARDISERLQTEMAIRKGEEKYRIIFENVQDVYYETSIEGRIIEVSPSIEVLSRGRYRMEDLIGKSMYEFYSEPNERQLIIEELKEKGFVSDFEVTLRNSDGLVTPCSISAKLIFDSEGHPEKIIGSMRDITDRKNVSDALKLAKEKAETSDMLKTEFLNNISHEVRTPLNGILGFAEIISAHDLSQDEKKDALAMLFESSNRLLNTITNYMDISLITSGSLSVNYKDINPAIILRKLFNNFESACQNKKLELLMDIPEHSNDLTINSDPEICHKILSHFLENAVKFTEKGSIHFGFNRWDEQVEFFVRDTGSGINPDSFNTIFERFVKENQGPLKVSEGSGLGLSIARGMSEAIGGNIRLESLPGMGSCFYLTIPASRRSEVSPPEMQEKVSDKPGFGSKIIIAEDDETNFYYLNALITKETGAKILHAINGREAIDLFRANPDIKLILMDMKMPEIDGFEATRQIKSINSNVYIIAITAYAMSGDEERIIAAGCDGYVSKPINKKSLLEKIAEFITIK
jgi:PAS domain S-box-containing protein